MPVGDQDYRVPDLAQVGNRRVVGSGSGKDPYREEERSVRPGPVTIEEPPQMAAGVGSIGNNPDPWVHRSIQMKCRTCMWYTPKQADSVVLGGIQRQPLGRCRRHAPSMNGYPAVMEMDWCGDHKIDENKI